MTGQKEKHCHRTYLSHKLIEFSIFKDWWLFSATTEDPTSLAETTTPGIEDGLTTIIILIPVVLVVLIIGMIVCGIYINRRWNQKARNQGMFITTGNTFEGQFTQIVGSIYLKYRGMCPQRYVCIILSNNTFSANVTKKNVKLKCKWENKCCTVWVNWR